MLSHTRSFGIRPKPLNRTSSYLARRLTITSGLARDGDYHVLIVGGEDHKTAQAFDFEQRFANLEEWTREHFPAAAEVLDRWSGQVMEPVDALAYIGLDPSGDDNVYVVTGDSGNGMTSWNHRRNSPY